MLLLSLGLVCVYGGNTVLQYVAVHVFPSPQSVIRCWVDIGHGGRICIPQKLANTTIQDIPHSFFFLEKHLLLTIYNHTLSGMPRNKEIDTAFFCVICLVIFKIYSHSEGKKQLIDKGAPVRKQVEIQSIPQPRGKRGTTSDNMCGETILAYLLALQVIFGKFTAL